MQVTINYILNLAHHIELRYLRRVRFVHAVAKTKAACLVRLSPLKPPHWMTSSTKGHLRWFQAGHCNNQWQTSSTSLLWHSLHVLSFLSTPCLHCTLFTRLFVHMLAAC